jgi:predicted aldo/keto reductase-like oxidoreductase
MEFVQLQLNYIDVLRGQAGAWQQIAIKHDKPIIVMEPIKGGTLANLPPAAEKILKAHAPDRSVASWAIRYAATLEGATCLLSGMSDLNQMKDNINSFKPLEPLSETETKVLENALAELSKISVIPCTACKYCLADCPKGIDIPSCLNLYNEVKRGGAHWNLASLYRAIPRDNRAEACTECGICIERCPQKIDIPKELKEVVKALR